MSIPSVHFPSGHEYQTESATCECRKFLTACSFWVVRKCVPYVILTGLWVCKILQTHHPETEAFNSTIHINKPSYANIGAQQTHTVTKLINKNFTNCYCVHKCLSSCKFHDVQSVHSSHSAVANTTALLMLISECFTSSKHIFTANRKCRRQRRIHLFIYSKCILWHEQSQIS